MDSYIQTRKVRCMAQKMGVRMELRVQEIIFGEQNDTHAHTYILLKGSLDEKLPSYEVLKCLENRCQENRCLENRCLENRCLENRCLENRCQENRCLENRCLENRCQERIDA